MSWERISLLVPAVCTPFLFAVVGASDAHEWALPLQITLQATLAAMVVALIAHGANWLVDAACRIAQALGLSHLVIGLTVVAFGTSAPEVAASLVAGFRGSGDLAVANVVGSNVFNLCFILGGVALLLRGGLATESSLVRRDGPMLLLGTVLLFLFVGALPGHDAGTTSEVSFWPQLLNRRMERGEGLCLLIALIGYLFTLYRSRASQEPLSASDADTLEGDFGAFSPRDVPMFMLGLAVVVGGCQLLVGDAQGPDYAVEGYGALWFARVLHVPDYVVGVTIVAAGTSAPELVVSLVAAVRGAHGLSAGNLVGSDIFNFYGVLGLAGVLLQPPLAPPVAVTPELLVGVAVPILVVACAIFVMWTGMRISRREGALLLAIGLARWVHDLSVG